MDAGGSRSRIPPGGVIGRPGLEVPSRAELRFRGEGGISEPQVVHAADVFELAKLVEGLRAYGRVDVVER